MPGGFAGVDVFFVISGFLMTGIIFKGLEQEKFSTVKFYLARANRIIPALAMLCFVLLLLGWFFLTPYEYQSLGKHVVGSVSFLSNIMYWQESGYFDVASHEKWLLHTWSLSTEWQFYIIYPLILVVLHRFMSLKAMKLTLLIGTLLGFAFCIVATTLVPGGAYYLLPTRAWEMMAGGVAFLYPFTIAEKNKKLLEWLGLILILAAYFFISQENAWPGYLAFIPVLGTFFVIQAQRNNSVITNNIVFQKLGLWSYSIYLWHWPVVVAVYTFSLPPVYLYCGIVLSIILGMLSYHFIERIKFNNVFPYFYSYLACKPMHMALLIGVLGFSVFYLNGVPSRFDIDQRYTDINKEVVMPLRNNGYCFYSFNDGYANELSQKNGAECYLGTQEEGSKTLLFGDSHAGHYEPFWHEIFRQNKASLQVVSTNWCAPSLADSFPGPTTHISYQQCLLNKAFVKNNLMNFETLILAGAWGSVLELHQLEHTIAFIEKAATAGKNVIIMASPYQYAKSPLITFYRTQYFGYELDMTKIKGHDDTVSAANKQLKDIAEKSEQVHFIERTAMFSSDGTFNVDDLNIPYSLDDEHISMIGSKNAAQYFLQQPQYKAIQQVIF